MSILTASIKCPECGFLINTEKPEAKRTDTHAECPKCHKSIQLPERLIKKPEEPIILYLGYFNGFWRGTSGTHVATSDGHFLSYDINNLDMLIANYDKLYWHKSINDLNHLAYRCNIRSKYPGLRNAQLIYRGYYILQSTKQVLGIAVEDTPLVYKAGIYGK